MSDWFADECFWETSFPFMFGAQRFQVAPREVDQLMTLTGIHHGNVLDLGTGPGRHAVAFAKAGCHVTGVDLSGFLLDKARAHAVKEEVRVEWKQQSMVDFERSQAFDLAVCLNTSFGFFEADEANRRVLQRVHESLQPGGTFVLDVMGKETLAHIFQAASAAVVPGVGTQFSQRSLSPAFTHIENEWTFVLESGTVRHFVFRHWVYSAHELRLMLHDSGFSTVDIYGNFEGHSYDLTSRRLVAVATRSV